MKLFVIGFPKSGTTTLNKALDASGMSTLHWRQGEKFLGKMIYDAYMAGEDPLRDFADIDCITQADVCLPRHKLNYWPNLDFQIIAAIRRYHPDCLLALNYRDPVKVVSSMNRWLDMRKRFVASDIPGLPKGFGAKDSELLTWIEGHYDACRRLLGSDPNFFEYDIEDPKAPQILSERLGIELAWWGKANVNEAA